MTYTHHIRAAHDAILIGVDTLISDDPSLTVRHCEGSSPVPIIIDSRLRTPLTCKLLTSPQCVKPVIVTTTLCDPEAKSALEGAGATIVMCNPSKEGRVDLCEAVDALYPRFNSIMIEGGAGIISSFLEGPEERKRIGQVIITIAPLMVGGLHYCSKLLTTSTKDAYPSLTETVVGVLDQDIVVIGKMVSP
jgi:GTP cyclohydrolase II